MEQDRKLSRRRVLTGSSALAGVAVIAACSSDAVSDAVESNESNTASTTAAELPESTAVDINNLPDGPLAMVDPATVPRGEEIDFGPAPDVPDGPLSDEVAAAVAVLYGQPVGALLDEAEVEALVTIANSGDPRLAWLLSDHIRVAVRLAQNGGATQIEFFEINGLLESTAGQLTGQEFSELGAWNPLTSALIAWDIPEPPDYLAGKRNIYIPVEPAWAALMTDNSVLDWRIVSWGGVLIDARPFDTTDDPCNCIPAIDNPTTLTAAEATWLDDDDIVFGVVINGEARAYPRQIMEVREMVNDTLGGRDFGMPYCTLCGSAQVWFTDDLPAGIERPVLRTSGLLSRSNKVMYDLVSQSIFDTFRGTADTGALLDEGIELTGHTVVTSTWSAWRSDHPATTVLTEDLALGRDPDFRNNRDADGPIFPIGNVDPRLAIQEDVLGVLRDDGSALAIHVNSAAAAIDRGEVVQIDDIRVIRSGDGVRAINPDGTEIVAHQAFWFAWSQFYPTTELWPDV